MRTLTRTADVVSARTGDDSRACTLPAPQPADNPPIPALTRPQLATLRLIVGWRAILAGQIAARNFGGDDKGARDAARTVCGQLVRLGLVERHSDGTWNRYAASIRGRELIEALDAEAK